MKKTFLFFLAMPFFVGLAYSQNSYRYIVPKQLQDGWKTDHLESQQLDTTLFYRFFDQLHRGEHRLHSFLLVKNDHLILEEYFGEYDAETPHDLRSTSKSIRSILLGIALDEGFIEDINDPISKYLKRPVPLKNLDVRKNTITLKHLLTMSSGLDCNDWDKKSRGQEDKVYKKKDWLQYTLDLPMVNEPGEVAHYCSMGVLLLTEIIAQTSGMPIDVFANKYLFEPLGITQVGWGHTSNRAVIPSAKRIYMRPRDLAKIGQLVLQQGKWEGKNIVSKDWIKAATSPKTKITGIDYGYLWWNIPFPYKGGTLVAKTATGNGGQYIMVFPELNMVAIFTGGAYNSQEDKLAFAIIKDVVLPSIID